MRCEGMGRRHLLLVLMCATALVGAAPALAAGDLSKATIETEDLPQGFRDVPPGQLSEAGISTRQVGKTFAEYMTDARLLAYSVHATPNGDEVVESFLVGPLTVAEQGQVDQELADRGAIADSFSGAFVTPWAEATEPRILGTEGVGDSSLGFAVVMTTPSDLAHLESLFGSATGDRASVGLVFGRRGEYLHFVAVVHIGTGKPLARVVELARILDGKVGYRQGIEGFGPGGQTTSDGLNTWPLVGASAVVLVLVGVSIWFVLRRRRAAPALSPAAAVTASQPFPVSAPPAMMPPGSMPPWPTGSTAAASGNAQTYVETDGIGMEATMDAMPQETRAGTPFGQPLPGLPAAPPPQMRPATQARPSPGRAAGRARLVGGLLALAGWMMVLGWLVGIVAFGATSATSEGMAFLTWGKSSIAVYSPPILEFVWGITLVILGALMRRTKGRGAADERIVFPPQRIGRRLIGLGFGALPLVGLAFLSFFVVTGTIRDNGAEIQLGAWIGLAAAIVGLCGALGAIGVGIALRRHPTEVSPADKQPRAAASTSAPFVSLPTPPAVPPTAMSAGGGTRVPPTHPGA